MDKVAIINQPAGLGDIIFCQKIAYRAINEFGCDKVLWPILDVYNYLPNYILQKNVFFLGQSEIINMGTSIINDDKLLYIPLVSSDLVTPNYDSRAHGHIKYKFFHNTDYSDWKDYFKIVRNFNRENDLIKFLNLDITQPYNFINCNFGTPPNHLSNKNITPNNNYNNVYMDIIPGFTIFDWLTIIENSSEIHTMETSLYYILEKLGIEKNVYIYSKYKFQHNQYDDYGYMKNHCSKKWNYV